MFNGTAVDQSAVLQSLVNTRGEFNKVHIDHTVISNYDLWVHATFGQRNDFIMTNSVAKAFTGYPNGQYFGGITWGGGSWMGTRVRGSHSCTHHALSYSPMRHTRMYA